MMTCCIVIQKVYITDYITVDTKDGFTSKNKREKCL